MENETTITVMELVRAGGHGVSPQHLHHAFSKAKIGKTVKSKPRRVLYNAAEVAIKIATMLGNAYATNYTARDSKAAAYEAMLQTCFGYTTERLEAVEPLTTVGRGQE